MLVEYGKENILDDDDTTLGFALPDASWDDLNDRSSNFNSQVK